MTFLIRHLLESTVFCLLLSLLACGLYKSATATVRHTIWLIGVSKFALPTVLLAKTGAQLAFFWPAASWLSAMANKVQTLLFLIAGYLPSGNRCLLIVWSLGTALLFAAWFKRLRQSRLALALPTPAQQAALQHARRRLSVRLPVQLRTSEASFEPALRGLWRATITMPAGLSEKLSAAEFESVLLHELAHARRLDNLTGIFVHCIACLFWFHPLLWLVESRLSIERERACDELVIACGAEPDTYATGILKVCEFHLFGAPSVAAGISALTGAGLTRRLELILNRQSSAGLVHVPRLLIAGLAMLMTLFPIAGGYCEQCASTGQTDQPQGATK